MKPTTILIIWVLLVTPWIWNTVKFASCDFKSDYKCEVIHIIGVIIPPAAYITVWFADDGE
jgi:hypothetical protein